MTAALFDVIRYELLYGEGLPLGLLSSGFVFSKFEFFSRGTWAWFRGKSGRWQKIFVLACLTVTAVLASVIGPASAVLMLPRQMVSSRSIPFPGYPRLAMPADFPTSESSCLHASFLAEWNFGRSLPYHAK